MKTVKFQEEVTELEATAAVMVSATARAVKDFKLRLEDLTAALEEATEDYERAIAKNTKAVEFSDFCDSVQRPDYCFKPETITLSVIDGWVEYQRNNKLIPIEFTRASHAMYQSIVLADMLNLEQSQALHRYLVINSALSLPASDETNISDLSTKAVWMLSTEAS
jgi:hypothetical protein